MAIRTPKCCHFGRSASKTVRFWGTDCHGATPLAMTVLFQIAFFDSLKDFLSEVLFVLVREGVESTVWNQLRN